MSEGQGSNGVAVTSSSLHGAGLPKKLSSQFSLEVLQVDLGPRVSVHVQNENVCHGHTQQEVGYVHVAPPALELPDIVAPLLISLVHAAVSA